MLNSGNKFHALRDKKKKNILILVLSKKKRFLNETKKHSPPCKLNGRSLSGAGTAILP